MCNCHYVGVFLPFGKGPAGGYLGPLKGSGCYASPCSIWIEATCGLQSNGNAMSHSSGEALYVWAMAV